MVLAELLCGVATLLQLTSGTALHVPAAGRGGAPNMNGAYQVMKGTGMVTMPPFSAQDPKNEFFDVYSPEIKTLYGQVFWTLMDGTALPPPVVARFKNKTMAVVGYECNQVAEDPVTGEEYAIPINAAYNHHHGAFLKSTNARMKREPLPAGAQGHADSDGMVWVAEDQRAVGERTGPASTTFHEGNGGEYRKSYHGYAKGFAQLVESPASFHMQPMQIDTWNRSNVDAKGRPSRTFVAGIQPRNSAQTTAEAKYSGLLECPCTDRITKVTDATTRAQAAGTCAAGIATADACLAAARVHLLGQGFKPLSAVSSGSDPSKPAGCSVTVPRPAAEGGRPTTATAFFNRAAVAEAAPCGSSADGLSDDDAPAMWGRVGPPSAAQPVAVWVHANATHLLITAAGPKDVWFGVGVNATTMAGQPWTLVVDGSGAVSEHKLGLHEAGTLLPRSVTVLSSKLAGPLRVVVASRPLSGDPDEFNFQSLRQQGDLSLITAVGSSSKFAYHKQKAVATVNMVALGAATCLCSSPSTAVFGKGAGQLVYTPVDGEPGGAGSSVPGASATSLGFRKDCLAYPAGTMLLEKNPSCDIRAYTGGQSCCHHLFTLLDKHQKTPDQDKFLVYRMKWRFWFQEVTPDNMIQDVEQFNWGGMASPTEYDVPKCGTGVFGCSKGVDGHWTHMMNGTWTVKDMHASKSRANEPQPTGANATAVRFLSIHGHCHAPTCLQFDLWNADTNELICSQRPLYGSGNGDLFQEEGYLNTPPCLFGAADQGLAPSPGGDKGLPMATKLFSRKICRADYAHHGEMSLWQSYGQLV